MAQATRWGFMGCGRIANDFANAMKLLPKSEHEIVAVGADDLSFAQDFASKFGVKHAFKGYEKVANCPEVDIVYINTLNPEHLECAKLAINADKAVLVEKPMGMNTKQVKEMIKLAKEKNVFIMEGYWSRFFPVYADVRRALADGTIGEPKFLQGCLGHELDVNEFPRIFDKKLGGSALMDFGCYLVMATTMIFNGQRPISINATGKLNDGGVDIMDCITLKYRNGEIAQLMLSAEVAMGQQLAVYGTKGQLEIEVFNCPTKWRLNSKEIEHPLPKANAVYNYKNCPGFMYEIQCIRECLQHGHKECPIMPLEHSLVIMEIIDEVRRQVGVVYPEDKQ